MKSNIKSQRTTDFLLNCMQISIYRYERIELFILYEIKYEVNLKSRISESKLQAVCKKKHNNTFAGPHISSGLTFIYVLNEKPLLTL